MLSRLVITVEQSFFFPRVLFRGLKRTTISLKRMSTPETIELEKQIREQVIYVILSQ